MTSIKLTTEQLADLGLPPDTIEVRLHKNGDVDYWTSNRSNDLRANKPWGFTLNGVKHRIAVMEVFPIGNTKVEWCYSSTSTKDTKSKDSSSVVSTP